MDERKKSSAMVALVCDGVRQPMVEFSWVPLRLEDWLGVERNNRRGAIPDVAVVSTI